MCSDFGHIITSISNHSALTIPDVLLMHFVCCVMLPREGCGVFYESAGTGRKSLWSITVGRHAPERKNSPPVNWSASLVLNHYNTNWP